MRVMSSFCAARFLRARRNLRRRAHLQQQFDQDRALGGREVAERRVFHRGRDFRRALDQVFSRRHQAHVLGAPVALAAHALDPAALDHAIQDDREVRRRDVERRADLLLVHVRVAGDQHQHAEVDDLQIERLHVAREHLAHLDRGPARRVAEQVGEAGGVEPGGEVGHGSFGRRLVQAGVELRWSFLFCAPR
jgi:hypothetical protein